MASQLIKTTRNQSSLSTSHENVSNGNETQENAVVPKNVRGSARISGQSSLAENPALLPRSSTNSRSRKSQQTPSQATSRDHNNETEGQTEKMSFITMDQSDTTETPRTNIEAFMTVAETEERVLRSNSFKRTPQHLAKGANKSMSFKAPKPPENVLKKTAPHLFGGSGSVASPGGSRYTPRTNIWNLLNIDTDAELTPVERNVNQSRIQSTRSGASISRYDDWGQEVTLSPMHVPETSDARENSTSVAQSFKKPKRRSFHIPTPEQNSDSMEKTTAETEADFQETQSESSHNDSVMDQESVHEIIPGLTKSIVVNEEVVENQKEIVEADLNQSAPLTLLLKPGENNGDGEMAGGEDNVMEVDSEFDDIGIGGNLEANIEGLIESLDAEAAEEEIEGERNGQGQGKNGRSLLSSITTYSRSAAQDAIAISVSPQITPSTQSELLRTPRKSKQEQESASNIGKDIVTGANTSQSQIQNQDYNSISPTKSIYDMSEKSSSEDSLSDFETRMSAASSAQKQKKHSASRSARTPVSKSGSRSISVSGSVDTITPSKTKKRKASLTLTNSGKKRSRLSFNEWKLQQQGGRDAIANLSKSKLSGPRSSTPSDRSKRFFHSTWRQSSIGQYLEDDRTGPLEKSVDDPFTGLSPIRTDAPAQRDRRTGTEGGASFRQNDATAQQINVSELQQKTLVDHEFSDELPSGLSPLSTPRIDLRKRLSETTIQKSVRLAHHSGRDASGQSKTSKNETEKQAKKQTSKRKRKAPASVLPTRSVKFFAERHSTLKLSKDAVEDIEKVTEVFWDSSFKALEAYALHAGRKIITEEDVILLMKKQRVIKNISELHDYIREYLPMELRSELIPMAKP